MELHVCIELKTISREQHEFLSALGFYKDSLKGIRISSYEIFCLCRSSKSSFQMLTHESSHNPLEMAGQKREHGRTINLSNMAVESGQGTRSSSMCVPRPRVWSSKTPL